MIFPAAAFAVNLALLRREVARGQTHAAPREPKFTAAMSSSALRLHYYRTTQVCHCYWHSIVQLFVQRPERSFEQSLRLFSRVHSLRYKYSSSGPQRGRMLKSNSPWNSNVIQMRHLSAALPSSLNGAITARYRRCQDYGDAQPLVAFQKTSTDSCTRSKKRARRGQS